MLTTTVPTTHYLLPDDAAPAQAALLAVVTQATQRVWVVAFAFSWQPLFVALEAADARGIACHLLLDSSQAQQDLARLKALGEALTHGDLTLATAGPPSPEPGQIWHPKACWNDMGQVVEGSTNFTATAWAEGNLSLSYTDSATAQALTIWWEAHRAYALANVPQFQKGPVTT
jgi:phosphatidylserine/phosphatidylglycerophosphate/cardiolipin synthase-like enzyme